MWKLVRRYCIQRFYIRNTHQFIYIFKVDREELRKDRGVDVPQQEVHDLIAELFRDCDPMNSIIVSTSKNIIVRKYVYKINGMFFTGGFEIN